MQKGGKKGRKKKRGENQKARWQKPPMYTLGGDEEGEDEGDEMKRKKKRKKGVRKWREEPSCASPAPFPMKEVSSLTGEDIVLQTPYTAALVLINGTSCDTTNCRKHTICKVHILARSHPFKFYHTW